MPTCRDIVTLAMKQAQILAPGAEPTAGEAADGMDALQGLYEGWVSGGMFGQLTDDIVSVGGAALLQHRITATDGAVITLPTTVDRDGDDLAPYDLSVVEIIDATGRKVHLFEAGTWRQIDALGLSDKAPLASRGRDGLAACLAMSFAEQFAASIGPGTANRARQFKTALMFKLGADRPRTAAEYF